MDDTHAKLGRKIESEESTLETQIQVGNVKMDATFREVHQNAFALQSYSDITECVLQCGVQEGCPN